MSSICHIYSGRVKINMIKWASAIYTPTKQ